MSSPSTRMFSLSATNATPAKARPSRMVALTQRAAFLHLVGRDVLARARRRRAQSGVTKLAMSSTVPRTKICCACSRVPPFDRYAVLLLGVVLLEKTSLLIVFPLVTYGRGCGEGPMGA